MLKTSTDFDRHALNGETMGTRWAALFFREKGFDPAPVAHAMQASVNEVDRQMSTWKPDSDLMRLNAAAPEQWVALPQALMDVLAAALDIGRASGGAFDISVGDAVSAWGFGPDPAEPDRIGAALARLRKPAPQVLELDPGGLRARKHSDAAFDLSAIAKGYGVDRLAAVARAFGIDNALLSIDGELCALGLKPDGTPWTVAIEEPDYAMRRPLALMTLQDAAAATSGDYRHWVDVGGARLSHTIDPARGGPLTRPPASVTVVAETCMQADAWATALMVAGTDRGARFAREMNLHALFVDRCRDGFVETPVGALFETPAPPHQVA